MTWSEAEVSSPQLDALVELSRNGDVQFSSAELDAGLELVTARLAAHHVRQRRLKALLAAAVLVVGVLSVGLTTRWLSAKNAPLAYSVQGGALLDAGYLREDGSSGVVVTFEEGTKFALAPGARARLREVTREGARLGLEGGAASFDVTPNASHHWEVEVGPFLVQVKGTSFDLSWQPEFEQFELNLKRGKVLVTGPVSGGELNLHGGQHLVVHLRKGETRITDAVSVSSGTLADALDTGDTGATQGTSAAAHALDSEYLVLPSAVAGTAVGDAPAPGVSGTQAASSLEADPTASARNGSALEPAIVRKSQRDWARAMARGEWKTILREAESVGIQKTISTVSAEDLFTLANAARYTQRTSLARDALVALRQRFPGSGRIADATFLLGRVEEALGQVRASESHYDEYMARAPNGAYAAEALGRKMTLSSRSFGPARARTLAEEYLQRFPNGSYAESARALLKAR